MIWYDIIYDMYDMIYMIRYDIAVATDHLEFLLGCRAMIHCQHHGSDAKSFSWFYKEDERSDRIQLFFQDKKGLKYHSKSSRPKLEVLRNGTLAIEYATQEHQGLYWCEACNENSCQKQFNTISVKKGENRRYYQTHF